jgi:hypothetical protein
MLRRIPATFLPKGKVPGIVALSASAAGVCAAGCHYSYESSHPMNENIRKNMLGFVIGAEFYYQRAVYSSRLGWDLIANNGDGTSTTPRYKNQWIQFTLGFKF